MALNFQEEISSLHVKSILYNLHCENYRGSSYTLQEKAIACLYTRMLEVCYAGMWVWLYMWTDEVSRCKLVFSPSLWSDVYRYWRGDVTTTVQPPLVSWWHHSTQQQQTQNRTAEKINFERGEINFKPGDSHARKTCREDGVVHNNADITWWTIEN